MYWEVLKIAFICSESQYRMSFFRNSKLRGPNFLHKNVRAAKTLNWPNISTSRFTFSVEITKLRAIIGIKLYLTLWLQQHVSGMVWPIAPSLEGQNHTSGNLSPLTLQKLASIVHCHLFRYLTEKKKRNTKTISHNLTQS